MASNLRIVLFVLAALAAGTASAAIVANGSFENGTPPRADRWGIDGQEFAVVDGEGINATRALVWKGASDPKRYALAGQEIKLRPGGKYRFSASIKTEGLAGPGWSGAMVIVDWCDADGKWISEVCTKRLSGTHDWTHVEFVTPALPANAAKCHVQACVTKGCFAGKAWFDDIAVEALDVKPVEGLYSSAYRDLGADEDGEVTFFANLFLDPACDLKDFTADFLFISPDRFVRRIPAAKLTRECASLKMNLADLPYGKQPVAFEIASRDGKVRDSASLLFERVKAFPKRKVRIDRFNRLIVDGKPFFPLGFYAGGMTDEQLRFYRRGPFNCVCDYNPLNKANLDRCAKAGIKVIGNLKAYHSDMPKGWIPSATNQHDMAEVFCASVVNRFKDHPAILAWYVNDEQPATEKYRMARRRKFLAEFDPDHPTYSVIYQIPEAREHRSTCDVLGTDPYPINDHPMDICSTWAEATKAAMFGGPVWQVPQAFDYAWFLGKDSPRRGEPSQEEIVSMYWQPIACGANGLIAYAFHHIWSDIRDAAARDAFFDRYCSVGRDVARFFPVLLSTEPAPAVTGAEASCRARTWCLGDKAYLLVCNVTRERRTAKLRLSEAFSSLESKLYGTIVRLAGDVVTAELPPLGVAMTELSK